MKITVDEHGELLVDELFNGVGIPTEKGIFGIAQRDDGIEVMLNGKQVYPAQELVKVICADQGAEWLATVDYENRLCVKGWGETKDEAIAGALRKMADFIDQNRNGKGETVPTPTDCKCEYCLSAVNFYPGEDERLICNRCGARLCEKCANNYHGETLCDQCDGQRLQDSFEDSVAILDDETDADE